MKDQNIWKFWNVKDINIAKRCHISRKLREKKRERKDLLDKYEAQTSNIDGSRSVGFRVSPLKTYQVLKALYDKILHPEEGEKI